MFAESLLDGDGFHFVVELGRGAVRVEIVDILRVQAGVANRLDHGARRAVALRVRGGDVVGIPGQTPRRPSRRGSGRPVRPGVFQALQDQDAASLAHDESVAFGVERAARVLRVVVPATRERRTRRSRRKPDR